MSKAVKKIVKKAVVVVAAAAAVYFTGGLAATALSGVLGATAGSVASTVISYATSVAIGAVAGGVASKLTGGSFKEGALVGAMTGGFMEFSSQMAAGEGLTANEQFAQSMSDQGGMTLADAGEHIAGKFDSLVESGKGLLDRVTGGNDANVGLQPDQVGGLQQPTSEPGWNLPEPVEAQSMPTPNAGAEGDVGAWTGAERERLVGSDLFGKGTDVVSASDPFEAVGGMGQGVEAGGGIPDIDLMKGIGSPGQAIAQANTGKTGLMNWLMGKADSNIGASVLTQLGQLGVAAFASPSESYMDAVKAKLWYDKQKYKDFGTMPDGWEPPNTWGSVA